MTAADPHAITSVEELRRVYEMPNPLVVKSKLDFLDDHMLHFMSLAPFVCISSETQEGLDASPRGGAAGFVKALDRKTVAFGDWPGNNKLETLTSIVEKGRCGLLFLVPRLDVFFRINGLATVTRDPALLDKLREQDKLPKTAVKIAVREAYFHCGKAFRRSGLWKPEQWGDASGFPTVGKVLLDIVKIADFSAEQLEAMYQHGLREELY